MSAAHSITARDRPSIDRPRQTAVAIATVAMIPVPTVVPSRRDNGRPVTRNPPERKKMVIATITEPAMSSNARVSLRRASILGRVPSFVQYGLWTRWLSVSLVHGIILSQDVAEGHSECDISFVDSQLDGHDGRTHDSAASAIVSRDASRARRRFAAPRVSARGRPESEVDFGRVDGIVGGSVVGCQVGGRVAAVVVRGKGTFELASAQAIDE